MKFIDIFYLLCHAGTLRFHLPLVLNRSADPPLGKSAVRPDFCPFKRVFASGDGRSRLV